MTCTIKQTLTNAATQLINCSDSAQADAEILLSHVLESSRTSLHTWPGGNLDETQTQQFSTLLQRRLNGEPIAHITASRAFWDFDLKITADTLIPRPETELLVELALEKIPAEQALQVLDLGTGSGAIALAIAHERPLCNVTAIEKSAAALEVARHNQSVLELDNLQIFSGSWFSTLDQQTFDIIVSNPPYIAHDDPHLLQGDVRFEPRAALESGPDGLDDIRIIVKQAYRFLLPEGWLMLEHGYDQGEPVEQLLQQHNYKNIQQFKDLSNHTRVTTGQK